MVLLSMVNQTCGIAHITDGASNTILYAEDAGRPQLWRNGQAVPGTLVSGGGWASLNGLSRLIILNYAAFLRVFDVRGLQVVLSNIWGS
jgi:hypothetical protein